MHRNLSINRHFIETGRRHVPKYRFNGSSQNDWQEWQAALRPQLLATLGELPKRPPLNAEVLTEWTDEGLVKQRFVIDVEEGLSATGYLFRPEKAAGPLPAILACHGHGVEGKDLVMGCTDSPAATAKIARHNYDFGRQMAKQGFVTIAIDWRGFGERDDRRKPHYNDLTEGRDQCNLHFLRALLLGQTMLGANISDGQAALDYLCGQSFVDSKRIGVMGISFGGTMALWMALADARIKAVDCICYADRLADFAMRDTNICGSQMTPGQFALCDIADLHGLIAPRPLLMEIGIYDECFHIDSAMSCYRDAQQIFEAAGQADKLELDCFPGGHAWGGNKTLGFFKKYLQG